MAAAVQRAGAGAGDGGLLKRYLMSAQVQLKKRGPNFEAPIYRHLLGATFYATEEDCARICQMFNLGTFGNTLNINIVDDPLANPTTVSEQWCDVPHIR
jgi:hypothetical protein